MGCIPHYNPWNNRASGEVRISNMTFSAQSHGDGKLIFEYDITPSTMRVVTSAINIEALQEAHNNFLCEWLDVHSKFTPEDFINEKRKKKLKDIQ